MNNGVRSRNDFNSLLLMAGRENLCDALFVQLQELLKVISS